jgi:hypothetical protein
VEPYYISGTGPGSGGFYVIVDIRIVIDIATYVGICVSKSDDSFLGFIMEAIRNIDTDSKIYLAIKEA